MRALSLCLALLVGFICWGLASALSGGVAPLGKVGATESAIFFTPIALFALPLSVVAFVRSSPLIGVWIVAVAPALGFLNFAIAVSSRISSSDRTADAAIGPVTFWPVWLALIALALGLVALDVRMKKRDRKGMGS